MPSGNLMLQTGALWSQFSPNSPPNREKSGVKAPVCSFAYPKILTGPYPVLVAADVTTGVVLAWSDPPNHTRR
jgi:hypothetical protein